MLTRLRIKNYRSVADLALDFGGKALLMGRNGSGKTSIFDALSGIRELVIEGERCETLFPLSGIPRWLKEEKPQVFEQQFEVDLEGPHGVLRYELVIEQSEVLGRTRVRGEKLTTPDGKPLFVFHEGNVQLYRDDHSKGPEYTFDWNRSAIGSVLPGPENRMLMWFKERLRAIECLRIDAPRMAARSEREEPRPAHDLSNFPSWYRRALVSHTTAAIGYRDSIREVIGGMESLDLHELGQGIMVLRAAMTRPQALSSKARPAKTYWLGFDELSDGQRALIGLYALLHFMVQENTTLCIDEPDNYLALAEIQPWLFQVQDRVDTLGAQVLLASHHPELLNMLAPESGVVLEREASGPTTARRYSGDPGTDLTPAERVARGWERE